MPVHEYFVKGRGIERIAAFSDGVFAIAITLLVLNLKIPSLPDDASTEALWTALLADLPNLQAYVLSFLVIGLFWMTHHRVFAYIRRYDTTLVWLNLFLLLFVCVLPYPTAMLGRFGGALPVRIYVATLTAVSLWQTAIWLYATRGRRLVDADLPHAVVRYALLRGLCTLSIFFGALAVSYYSASVALLCLGLIPVALIALRRL
jgi:uncharacterized membrane protein